MEPLSISADNARQWTDFQKKGFRFFFIFLTVMSLFAYNVIFALVDTSFENEKTFYGIVSKPLAWIDSHLFHVGYIHGKNTAYFQDTNYGWAFVPTLFLFSLIGMAVWSISDRKRTNYDRLLYWFSTYLSYYLVMAMLPYAIIKIIPVQMHYPNINELLMPLGSRNRFSVARNFIGVSPGYSLFTGLCELTACFLVLCRRTRVFGLLFMATVLTNVVCLNMFYNIPVKLNSMQLLLTDLFLLAPYVPRLFRLFYYLQPVSLNEKRYVFSTSWKRYLLLTLLLLPGWIIFTNTDKAIKRYKIANNNRQGQKLFEVGSFIKGADTVPPLLTDTLRWKRFSILGNKGIIYNMKDETDWYTYQPDSVKKTFTLIDYPDTSRRFYFRYSLLSNKKMYLQGTWKGQDVSMELTRVEIDSLPLVQEKTKWIQGF